MGVGDKYTKLNQNKNGLVYFS